MDLKKRLLEACLSHIHQRIETAEQALQAARDAANEETKSSAGDKYETGRAMMQLEQEKIETQLVEALRLERQLTTLDPKRPCEKCEAGSLVLTNQGKFFMAVGLGKIRLEGETFFIISMKSPAGMAFSGKKAGEEVFFQNRKYLLEAIF